MSDELAIPKQLLPWVIAAALGYGGGELTDVTGASAWKEAQKQELAEAAELRLAVTGLRAQNMQLLQLFDRCVVRVGPDE